MQKTPPRRGDRVISPKRHLCQLLATFPILFVLDAFIHLLTVQRYVLYHANYETEAPHVPVHQVPGYTFAPSGKMFFTVSVQKKNVALTRQRHFFCSAAVRQPFAGWRAHRESFMPMWQEVAMRLAEEDPRRKKKLVMAKFDCEQVRPWRLQDASGSESELVCRASFDTNCRTRSVREECIKNESLIYKRCYGISSVGGRFIARARRCSPG